MAIVTAQEVWEKCHSGDVNVSQFALGLDLTLKAMQMALRKGDNSLTVPIFLAGLQNVDLGYSVTFESQGGEEYTIGLVNGDGKSLIESSNAGVELANQIVGLRQFAQSERIDINAAR